MKTQEEYDAERAAHLEYVRECGERNAHNQARWIAQAHSARVDKAGKDDVPGVTKISGRPGVAIDADWIEYHFALFMGDVIVSNDLGLSERRPAGEDPSRTIREIVRDWKLSGVDNTNLAA